MQIPKRILHVGLVVAVAGAVFLLERLQDTQQQRLPDSQQSGGSNQELIEAISAQRSDVQIQGSGTIERVLPDDNTGSRHQRLILRLEGGQTLLIAHNIDLAPRVPDPKPGELLEFFGEYEWNDRGGVIHWTHHDPGGRHVGGWLKYRGQTYQ